MRLNRSSIMSNDGHPGGIKHLENTIIETVKDDVNLAQDAGRGSERELGDVLRLGGDVLAGEAVIERTAHEHAIDGKLIGAHAIYDSATALESIEGIKPHEATASDGHARVVYINGIWNDEAIQRDTMQRIADATGAEVIGLHNATGATKSEDVLQCLEDKLDMGKNAAVDSMAHLIAESVRSGEPLNVIAHSQGALCTSRAVDHAIRELRESGMDPDSIKDGMTNVHIQTFGGAAHTYPDGPQYFHHINIHDPVPTTFGYHPIPESEPPQALDTTATLEKFHLNRDAAQDVQHSINDTYIPHINHEMIQRYDTDENVKGHIIHHGPGNDPGHHGLGNDPDHHGLGNDPDHHGLGNDPDHHGLGNDPGHHGLGNDPGHHGFGNDQGHHGFGNDPGHHGFGNDPGHHGFGNDPGHHGFGNDPGHSNDS
jgi:hypothetical protein